MGSTFYGDCLVDDIALNTCAGSKTNFETTNTAYHTAINNNIVCDDFTFNGRTFANRQKMCTNVTFDFAFNLDIARCF